VAQMNDRPSAPRRIRRTLITFIQRGSGCDPNSWLSAANANEHVHKAHTRQTLRGELLRSTRQAYCRRTRCRLEHSLPFTAPPAVAQRRSRECAPCAAHS
jgi:hypothetical protein